MTDSKRWFLLAGILILAGLVYLLSPVLTPFLIALLLAYMGDPMVDRLDKKIPRSISVLIVFTILSLVVLTLTFILLPMIERQLSSFLQSIPQYLDWLQSAVFPFFIDNLGISADELNIDDIKQSIKNQWTQAGGVAASFVATLSKSGMAIIAWVANIGLIPVLTFYLLRDWDILVDKVRNLIPRRYEPIVVKLVTDSDAVLSAFLRGQLMVMMALGAIYSIGLWIVGLEFSLLIGMLAGLVSFVPYLGFIVGIGVASVAAIVQFHDVVHLFPLFLVFGVGQIAESFLLTPLMVGDKIGLHPVAVIFAVLAGGQLFGFFGILMALPVAAVIMVLLRHAHDQYLSSQLYMK
ncbi:MAG: AI-2E family transporter [Gammaproteobacteria bacterium]|nr:AI-2E family transporter [Gammaproteobacteria bacterium]